MVFVYLNYDRVKNKIVIVFINYFGVDGMYEVFISDIVVVFEN